MSWYKKYQYKMHISKYKKLYQFLQTKIEILIDTPRYIIYNKPIQHKQSIYSN